MQELFPQSRTLCNEQEPFPRTKNKKGMWKMKEHLRWEKLIQLLHGTGISQRGSEMKKNDLSTNIPAENVVTLICRVFLQFQYLVALHFLEERKHVTGMKNESGSILMYKQNNCRSRILENPIYMLYNQLLCCLCVQIYMSSSKVIFCECRSMTAHEDKPYSSTSI